MIKPGEKSKVHALTVISILSRLSSQRELVLLRLINGKLLEMFL